MIDGWPQDGCRSMSRRMDEHTASGGTMVMTTRGHNHLPLIHYRSTDVQYWSTTGYHMSLQVNNWLIRRTTTCPLFVATGSPLVHRWSSQVNNWLSSASLLFAMSPLQVTSCHLWTTDQGQPLDQHCCIIGPLLFTTGSLVVDYRSSLAHHFKDRINNVKD